MPKIWISRFWFIPPVLIALLLFLFASHIKKPPEKADSAERAIKVRVIKVPRMPALIKAVGYGMTAPVRTWEAVSEVSGQVIKTSNKLKNGEFVPEGTELLHFDDSTYKLALAQIEAQLNLLDVKDRITKSTLVLEEKAQSILEKDFERKRTLSKQGSISSSLLEEAERELLKGQRTVQDLKNALDINSAERKLFQAQKALAELEIARTRIVAPFDSRITEVRVDLAQYISKGQALLSADDIMAVEVEAYFPIGKLRPLILAQPSEAKGSPKTIEYTPAPLDLDAVVRLKTALHTVEWQARVDRVSASVDPETQAMAVLVVVDKPYEKAQPGQRPALVKNTMVEVELRKRGVMDFVVIPTSSLHNGTVYVMDKDNRLDIHKVKTSFVQGVFCTISMGLEGGETLVVSDLVPAVKGMLLSPVTDQKLLKQLRFEATGQGEKQ